MKDLRFPRVRTVLWDRSNQGPPIHIHVSSFRKPQVCVSVSGLDVIKQHAASSLESQRISLYANIVYNKDGQRVSIVVDTAEENKSPDENKVMPIQVPILISKSKKCVFPPEDYTKAVKNVFVHCGSNESVKLNGLFSILGKCFVQKTDAGLLETCLEFDVITALTQIKVVPINCVPIMLTALSKDLASPMSWSNLHGHSRSGYITMDHARKLVLMIDSDPKIFTLPLIGIWVSGVESVCHPFVWAGCLRYLCNNNLQQRVCLPPSPFMLVLYSRMQTKPEFYECLPFPVDGKLHQMEIYTGFKSVHLSHKQDLLTVELNLLKYGIKKDKIDSAASRVVKVPGSKLEPVSSSDEMMPRSIPTPHQSKVPEAKFDVPEVSIIFSDNGHQPVQNRSLTVSCPSLPATNFHNPPTLVAPSTCSSYARIQNGALVSTVPSTTHQLLPQGNRPLLPGYVANQNLQLKGYNSQPVPCPPLTVNNPGYIQPRIQQPQAPYPPHHNLPSSSNMYTNHPTPPISGSYPRYSPYPPSISSQVPNQGSYNNKDASNQHPGFNSTHLVPIPCDGYPIVKSHNAVPQPAIPPVARPVPQSTMPPVARPPVHTDMPRFSYYPNQSNPIGSVARPVYMSTTVHPPPSFQPQINRYPMQNQNQDMLNQNNSARTQIDNGYYYRLPYCSTSHTIKSSLSSGSTPIYSPENSPTTNMHKSNSLDNVDTKAPEGLSDDVNNCRASRDSGLSDSPNSGPDTEIQLSKIQWENVPIEIYNLLMQQSAQLRDLKAQVQQLKLSQGSKSLSDSSSQGTSSTGVGTSFCDETPTSSKSDDKTCTVAVNTSFQYLTGSSTPVERASTLSVSLQTSPVKFLPFHSDEDSPIRNYSQEKISSEKSTECEQWQLSQNQNGSFTATMPDMSQEDLSAVAQHLSVDQKSIDSFQSEMVVDLPSYQTSLVRSTESGTTDRLPSLSSTHSLVSASMCANMHHTDSERDTDDDDDDDDTGHENPQVIANKPECYEQLINNVKQLLQRADAEEKFTFQNRQRELMEDSSSFKNDFTNGQMNTREDSLLFADDSCHRSELNLVDCTFVPKINYTSMLLDSDTETSLEINSLALKYLKDDQLTQMAKLHKQGATSSKPLCQNIFLQQIMRNNPDTSGADISKYGMCVNNLTFATRKYMEKHQLIEMDSKNNHRILQDSLKNPSPFHLSEQDASYPNVFVNGPLPSSSPPLACYDGNDKPRIIGPLAGAAGTVLPRNRFEPLSKSTPVLKPFPKIDCPDNGFVPIPSPRNEELDTENRILDIAKLKQLPKLL